MKFEKHFTMKFFNNKNVYVLQQFFNSENSILYLQYIFVNYLNKLLFIIQFFKNVF